jgi:hypothetical protein
MNHFPRCRAYWLDSRLRGNDDLKQLAQQVFRSATQADI